MDPDTADEVDVAALETPSGVTPATVGAVIEALGYPTIEQVAAQLSAAAGTPVSGRSVHLLSRLAGAKSDHPEFGLRRTHRYWMPFGAPDEESERLIRDIVFGLLERASDPRTFADEAEYAFRAIVNAVPEANSGDLKQVIVDRVGHIASAHAWENPLA